MVIHLETRVTSLFGVVDGEGNVVQKYVVQPEQNPNQPDPLTINVLNSDSFVNAFNAIKVAKDQLVAKVAEEKAKQEADNTKAE